MQLQYSGTDIKSDIIDLKSNITDLAKLVSPVRHDQQNLDKFCQGLTQDWYFAIEN
jgi:hypothetical protein